MPTGGGDWGGLASPRPGTTAAGRANPSMTIRPNQTKAFLGSPQTRQFEGGDRLPAPAPEGGESRNRGGRGQ
jgi:hypothetical protein